jgi:hypothetical protein
MEDVIQTNMLPYDPKWPVVCFDEPSKQLFGEIRKPQPTRRGSPAIVDYKYERKGVCCQLMMCEPLRGSRHVTVTERCTRQDDTHCIRVLVHRQYSRATKIRLVQDNSNTHDRASLYETFRPEEARRILDRIEFHYTTKHGSWLHMAETEINIMGRKCLDRRLDNRSLMAEEVAAWENARNARKARVHWTFTLAAAGKNSVNSTRQSKFDDITILSSALPSCNECGSKLHPTNLVHHKDGHRGASGRCEPHNLCTTKFEMLTPLLVPRVKEMLDVAGLWVNA